MLFARFRGSWCGKVLLPPKVCQPSIAREPSACCQDGAIKTRFAKATPRKTPNKVDKQIFERHSQIMRHRALERKGKGEKKRI